ncbi:hypothetical protein SORBI_3002G337001 [Sorghum bicolor]|uniref:Uncharacterized protein n=1 Tax=Sorghum bicolor TaxID=4558 RepID=A0A1W0W6P3_SORBI|nr:hypothetical protein SORBI_3002G337001 [Sorghum bicolor]
MENGSPSKRPASGDGVAGEDQSQLASCGSFTFAQPHSRMCARAAASSQSGSSARRFARSSSSTRPRPSVLPIRQLRPAAPQRPWLLPTLVAPHRGVRVACL